jgi:NAD(P)-dependent dehydrogenase (short-subunit alcohol dehydrogenase family)
MSDYKASQLPDLTDKTIVITGASSGIGLAAAAALARAGARVTLAVRNIEKGRAVAARISGHAEVDHLDLADLASIRRFTDGWAGPIDILINNAGVSERALRRTADGFEMTFGTNHLGHFALTNLLLPHVTDRVVTVASQAERAGRLDFDDLNWERRPYAPSRAYNDSKLANLLFTGELDRRLHARGSTVRAMAAHPGLVLTPIYDKPSNTPRTVWDRLMPVIGQDSAHGALPLLYAATEDIPGDSFVGPQHLMHMRGGAKLIGRSAIAKSATTATRLWDVSEQLTGIANA